MLAQRVAIGVLSALVVLAMALWSTRKVGPWWPALGLGLGRAVISYATGATLLTTGGTAVAGLLLGTLFFWVLQLLQGRWVWWIVLLLGVAVFSL